MLLYLVRPILQHRPKSSKLVAPLYSEPSESDDDVVSTVIGLYVTGSVGAVVGRGLFSAVVAAAEVLAIGVLTLKARLVIAAMTLKSEML
eukprot:2420795-Amphidinium_carterae.2